MDEKKVDMDEKKVDLDEWYVDTVEEYGDMNIFVYILHIKDKLQNFPSWTMEICHMLWTLFKVQGLTEEIKQEKSL